jgi:7-keto-8-aminopelargonate synthetase-like enzyme
MSGAGTAEHFGCLGATDLVMATFSKAFGAIGGVVAGDAEVIDYIKHHARSMIFSAALPPALTAGVGAALEIIQREPERRKAVLDRAAELRAALARHGFNTGASTTPIVPLIVGSRDGVAALWRALYDQGIFTSLIIPPAVPHGHELLRLTVSAAHTAEHIARLVDACADIARRLDIPRRSD